MSVLEGTSKGKEKALTVCTPDRARVEKFDLLSVLYSIGNNQNVKSKRRTITWQQKKQQIRQ
jgi:hypothetical protein